MHSEAPFLLSVNVGFDGLQACTDPGVPENGFRTPSGGLFPESSVTQFHCEDGFKLKGSTKRLCVRHPNGTLGWIPSDKPVCAREGKVRALPAPSGQADTPGRAIRPSLHADGKAVWPGLGPGMNSPPWREGPCSSSAPVPTPLVTVFVRVSERLGEC